MTTTTQIEKSRYYGPSLAGLQERDVLLSLFVPHDAHSAVLRGAHFDDHFMSARFPPHYVWSVWCVPIHACEGLVPDQALMSSPSLVCWASLTGRNSSRFLFFNSGHIGPTGFVIVTTDGTKKGQFKLPLVNILDKDITVQVA